jgi:hypothetical protein
MPRNIPPDLEALVTRLWPILEAYGSRIFEAIGTSPDGYQSSHAQEMALGLALRVVLMADKWGRHYTVKRLQSVWSEDEQIQAMEEWLVSRLCGERIDISDALDRVKAVAGKGLRPYEEIRQRKTSVLCSGRLRVLDLFPGLVIDFLSVLLGAGAVEQHDHGAIP